jgi:hypothetical protein
LVTISDQTPETKASVSDDDQNPYNAEHVAHGARPPELFGQGSEGGQHLYVDSITSDSSQHFDGVDTEADDEDGPRTGRSRKRSNDRANVRRIASKYDELTRASAEHLELLSTALNVPNSSVDLTVAIITGSRSGLSALNDTLALSVPGEPYDLIVAAISLGRQRIKGVWSVLAEMGAVNGQVPAGDVKAGGAIAKAAGSLSQENIDEITAVLTLAKK